MITLVHVPADEKAIDPPTKMSEVQCRSPEMRETDTAEAIVFAVIGTAM
ncbi:MAG TPA: hypothetical protein VFL57_12725 [Bryobacteraceae bacterium]|nr:hypothetical protein [Bryobacteraceae bacterium]